MASGDRTVIASHEVRCVRQIAVSALPDKRKYLVCNNSLRIMELVVALGLIVLKVALLIAMLLLLPVAVIFYRRTLY